MIRSKTPEYWIWRSMRDRCNLPTHQSYHNYGARGIFVCEKWNDFDKFIEDMGMRPAHDYELDRIDNDDGYHPDNCRWIDHQTQNDNRRSSRWITINERTQTMKQWSEETGINYYTMSQRYYNGDRGESLIRPTKKQTRRTRQSDI